MDPSAIAILPDEVPDYEARALIEKLNGSVKRTIFYWIMPSFVAEWHRKCSRAKANSYGCL